MFAFPSSMPGSLCFFGLFFLSFFLFSCEETLELNDEQKELIEGGAARIAYERVTANDTDTVRLARNYQEIEWGDDDDYKFEYGSLDYERGDSSTAISDIRIYVSAEEGETSIFFLKESIGGYWSLSSIVNDFKVNGHSFDEVRVFKNEIWLLPSQGIIQAKLDSGVVYERLF